MTLRNFDPGSIGNYTERKYLLHFQIFEPAGLPGSSDPLLKSSHMKPSAKKSITNRISRYLTKIVKFNYSIYIFEMSPYLDTD